MIPCAHCPPTEHWQTAAFLVWALFATVGAIWLFVDREGWKRRHAFEKRMRDHYEECCEQWRKYATGRHATPTPAEVKADRLARKLENLCRRSDNPHESALAGELARRARRRQ